MDPTPQEIQQLAINIATSLCTGAESPLDGNEAKIAEAVAEAISRNFAVEKAIQRQAERTLDELGSNTAGMDKAKLLNGIRDRLAKERGFVL